MTKTESLFLNHLEENPQLICEGTVRKLQLLFTTKRQRERAGQIAKIFGFTGEMATNAMLINLALGSTSMIDYLLDIKRKRLEIGTKVIVNGNGRTAKEISAISKRGRIFLKGIKGSFGPSQLRKISA